ncbi:MAG: isoleucine--tRNA ligase [Nitrososphaeraceae archaeon]
MDLLPTFDAKAIEKIVRSHWEKANLPQLIHKKLEAEKYPLLGFIEGPPTMNGDPHLGHLRGRIIKDAWFRIKTLQKNRVVFRAGWDTQGLPVELQAEKELGLTGSKIENIQKVGAERLVQACIDLIHRYNAKWIQSDELLGMSFNYSHAYWTYKDEYIEREWKYLHRAWEQGVLKEGFRVVAYCPSCQTSLSNAEVNQGYQNVEDPSLYYKVRLKEQDVFLVVWTTMPFTLVTDELVAVNPEAEYAYVNIGQEIWVMARERLEELFEYLDIREFEIMKIVSGKDLEGQRYTHPFLTMIPGLETLAKTGKIHLVVAESFVDTHTGSGIVHLSPANGEMDFQIATKRSIPIFVPIDDRVKFTEDAGIFNQLFVRDADALVIQKLKSTCHYVKAGHIRHQYPTCWRSHHKLVWLSRREYFYMTELLGSKPLDAAQSVKYFFNTSRNRFIEIIKEKVPWCITRERLWGTPLPIWSCVNCKRKDLLYSRKQVIERAISLPDGEQFPMHRPQLDRIALKCGSCGSIMQREQFVLDTWHNSGAAPYASQTDSEYHELVPSQFLTEGIDQTRGWAYTMLLENIILSGSPMSPYKSFLFQGHVLDEKGNKMSKSLGNVIDSIEFLNNNPVDIIRYYFLWKSSPAESLNFDVREMLSRPHQIISTLYYLHIYFSQNSKYDNYDPESHSLDWTKSRNLLSISEVWILSKFQDLISDFAAAFDECRLHEAAKLLEEFIINLLSQTYIPIVRNDLWDDNEESWERRLCVYSVLNHILKNLDIMLHPISPFVTEYLYQMCFKENESIILEKWPTHNNEYVNRDVESGFDLLKNIISLSNAARMKAKLKRRWPIDEVLIFSTEIRILNNPNLMEILKNQVNAQRCRLVEIPSFKSDASKLNSLIANGAPIKVEMQISTKRVAPRVKSNIIPLMREFKEIDKIQVLRSLGSEGKITVNVLDEKIVLEENDLVMEYFPLEGYSGVELDGLVVFISTSRSNHLIKMGFLRDLARNLQQLRKEHGRNPTDILPIAHVASLDQSEMEDLSQLKDELKFLVRVNEIVFSLNALGGVSYKSIDLDGRQILISI